MEKIYVPYVKQLKEQGNYVEVFVACCEAIRTQFDPDTTNGVAEEVMKEIMLLTTNSDNNVHPETMKLFTILEDVVFTLVHESQYNYDRTFLHKTAALNKKTKQILTTKQIFDYDDLKKIILDIKTFEQTIEQHVATVAMITEKKKKYHQLEDELKEYRESLINNEQHKGDGDKHSVIRKLKDNIKIKEKKANLLFEEVKRLLTTPDDTKQELKQIEKRLNGQIEMCLWPKLVIAVNDLKVISRECLNQQSAEKIVDKLERIKVHDMMDRIIGSTKHERVIAVDEMTNDLHYDDRQSISSKADPYMDKERSNRIILAEADLESRVKVENKYVNPKLEKLKLASSSSGVLKKGMKIKQKLFHNGSKLSFGWRRDTPWSLKKSWGFFTVECL